MKLLALMTLTLSIATQTLHATEVKPNQVLRWFGQTPSSYVSETPYGNNTATGRFVRSGDANIYFEVYGEGSPVVLLHGGLVGSLAEMGQFADKLKNDHQVILVNTRGHGKSDIGSVAPDYAQKAKDLKAVLTELGVERVDIIGFSDGAYTGYQFAADYPDAVHKLVAIGAGEWKEGFVQGGRKDRSTPFQILVDKDPRYWAQQAQIRPEPAKTEQWFKQANKQYDQTTVEKPLFESIHAPVLVLAGEDDMNAPLGTVLAAYKMLPDAQLAIIPNTPHPVFAVNFDAVWACIEPFITQ